MPIIYPSSRRRKGPTPIANHRREDGWNRYLDAFGLESLDNKREYSCDQTPDSRSRETSANIADGMNLSKAKKKKMELLDLPLEIQKQIFRFSSHPDLIALSLVSSHMRDIAAAHLYRSFHIVFPDDDDPANDYPIDSLASGFDTFVTSDYDYAAHLRAITLESLSTGLKGESAYRYYLYDASCGKFMNTLLLLTLRKAKALETFKWDIRVELSREVFKILHRIQPLQHLHVRMQVGESIHQNAPPLPSSTTTTSVPPSPDLPTPPPLSHHNSIVFIPPLPLSYSPHYNFGKGLSKSSIKSSSPSTYSVAPPTFSRFHNLKTLSVLDMDTHEYLEEIKSCLENSSGTLSTLKLSFSESLAHKARKPQPEIHSDDESDIEDEFGQLIPAPGVVDPSAPTKALKAQEEKKNQEAALGKIFGTEGLSSKLSIDIDTVSEKAAPKRDSETTAKHVKTFVNFYSKFMSQVKPGQEETPEIKEALRLIEKATTVFLNVGSSGRTSSDNVLGGSDGIATPNQGSPLLKAATADEVVMSGAAAVQEPPGLFDQPESIQKPSPNEPGVSNPDDIDIEAPEVDDLSLESEELLEASKSTANAPLPIDHSDDHLSPQYLVGKRFTRMERPVLTIPSQGKVGLNEDGAVISIDTDNAATKDINSATEQRKRSQYVRKTRGLTLNTFSLYYIPLKTSVLSKAVDFTVLKNITLLSVGLQVNFWSYLEKENKRSPLPLQKVHSDDVTMPFLNLVAQLEKLEELYMLERAPRRGVDNSASKTPVNTEHIRKAVLKRHVENLKVLVIRNDSGSEWDLNVKSVMLICQTATKLEELTASFGNKAMHSFLQFLYNLPTLRALHVLAFRTPDNCDFSRSELPRLVIDNLSNHPELKLEYLAFVDTVERLVRRKVAKRPEKSRGKEKASTKMKKDLPWDLLNTTFQNLGLPEAYDWQESSDDEVETQYGKNGLRIETYPLRPCDVFGMKIFEKEIISGRL